MVSFQFRSERTSRLSGILHSDHPSRLFYPWYFSACLRNGSLSDVYLVHAPKFFISVNLGEAICAEDRHRSGARTHGSIQVIASPAITWTHGDGRIVVAVRLGERQGGRERQTSKQVSFRATRNHKPFTFNEGPTTLASASRLENEMHPTIDRSMQTKS